MFWKTPEIVAWAKGRAFAWIDDEITDADRARVRHHHDGPARLHHVDPRRGLTTDDFTAPTAWATAPEPTPTSLGALRIGRSAAGVYAWPYQRRRLSMGLRGARIHR